MQSAIRQTETDQKRISAIVCKRAAIKSSRIVSRDAISYRKIRKKYSALLTARTVVNRRWSSYNYSFPPNYF